MKDSPAVPDTLDLADHGRMAINGMLGSLDPQLDYECTFLNILDVHPAYMLHWSGMVSGVMPKYIEALPMLRAMSGSLQDRELEQGFFDSILRNMADDGLIYDQLFNQKNNKGRQENQEIYERVLERTVGAFGHLVGARFLTPMMMHCCTGNGAQGLYYAWEGIVRREGEGAAVNMWLNRRSPWVDVYSSLPHEGCLELHNKTAVRLSVRQPAWARRGQIRCQVDGRDVTPEWRGNRLVFEGLRGGERIVVQAPVRVESVKQTVVNIADPHNSRVRYEIEFKGHTALSARLIAPPAEKPENDPNWYRLFRRETMRSAQPRLKPAPAYVHPERLVHWTV